VLTAISTLVPPKIYLKSGNYFKKKLLSHLRSHAMISIRRSLTDILGILMILN
jgi:hypothetical protein